MDGSLVTGGGACPQLRRALSLCGEGGARSRYQAQKQFNRHAAAMRSEYSHTILLTGMARPVEKDMSEKGHWHKVPYAFCAGPRGGGAISLDPGKGSQADTPD